MWIGSREDARWGIRGVWYRTEGLETCPTAVLRSSVDRPTVKHTSTALPSTATASE